MNKERLTTIDTLRGLASLAVCIYHLTNGNSAFLPNSSVKTVGSYGWLGVEIFFVISGFIIPYALFLGKYNLKQYGTFIVKRVTRLDPPYFLAIALVLALGYAINRMPGFNGPPFSPSLAQVLLHVAYLNTFFGFDWLSPVFWTLAIEFQYYLLVGLVFPFIANTNAYIRGTALAMLGTLAVLFPQGQFVFHWLFLFLLGMLAFQRRAKLIEKNVFYALLIPATIGTWYTLGSLIAFVGVATCLAILFTDVSNRVFLFLGQISYSLYLVHVPIGMRAINLGTRFATSYPAKLLLFAFAFALSVIAAYLFYLLVEKPAQTWAANIRYNINIAYLNPWTSDAKT